MHAGIGRRRWDEVDEALRAARTYWLCTTRPDGRPHAMPIWGVWHEAALWFGTGRVSVKGRNLARQPRALVHLESGDDVVILEGRAAPADDAAAFAAYAAKYAMPASADSFAALPQEGALYRFMPERAQAWLESSFVQSAARFRFEDGRAIPDGVPSIPV
jgi:hypothetical protein